MRTYLEMVRKIQKENIGNLNIIRCGNFYLCIGKDAIILNKLFFIDHID